MNFATKKQPYILTGDLRFLENQKLRKLISKGPNYREPRNINWNKCREVILNGLDSFIDSTSVKLDEKNENFIPWKNEVIEMLEANSFP